LGIDLPAADLTGTIADARFPSTLPAISGANLTGINAVVVGTTLPNPVSDEGSLFYKSDVDIFYISNGTQWNLVSNASPTTTGGTRTIDAISEGGTFSYDLGDDFTDDVDTDAQLIYTLTSGTLPSGCTLPTTGNSAFTGTASNVSSNTNYTWTIKVTDTSGGTATQDYQQTINTVAATTTGGTVTISAVNEGSSASYDVDTNFSYPTGSTFSAYSLVSGSLPSGLSLNTSTGVISGTMGEVASTTAYSFTIRGTDTDGDTVDQAYSWTITNVPFGATGGTITTYSSGSTNYKVHTFTSSGTITFSKSGSVDVLMVGGGGSGGGRHGGGGGGGGVLHITGVALTASSYVCTLGAGGGNVTGGTRGNSGSNTTFLGQTAIGGGAGGSYNGISGLTGGSGGGGGYGGSGAPGGSSQPGPTGGLTGTGYANNGGTTPAGYNAGGPGGGAGVAGTSSTPHAGNGIQINIDGNNYYWAGGGGAGCWGSGPSNGGLGGGGGGGAARENPAGIAGTGGGSAINSGTNGAVHPNNGVASYAGNGGANTGGGSGSSGQSAFNSYVGYSGNGGSGIVIVRYAV